MAKRCLNDKEVKKVFELYFDDKLPQNLIAKRFNVSKTVISLIIKDRRKQENSRHNHE